MLDRTLFSEDSSSQGFIPQKICLTANVLNKKCMEEGRQTKSVFPDVPLKSNFHKIPTGSSKVPSTSGDIAFQVPPGAKRENV